jgi:hypothetical protein
MVDRNVPRAFLSCAEEDVDFGKFLAGELLANGVDAWLYVWDVPHGESVRQRVEEGMNGADFVVPIVTPHSLDSEWCKLETDAAFVLKLRGSAKIVSIVKELSIDQISLFQQTLRVIEVNDPIATSKALVNTCLGLSDKPPLVQRELQRSMAKEGFSVHASKVAFMLAENSETGCGAHVDPLINVDEIHEALGIPYDEIEEAIDELVENGLIETHPAMGTSLRISPNDSLFWNADPYVKDWVPTEDAIKVAALVTNLKDGANMADVANKLCYGPRRMNPAVTYLTACGYIQADQAIGSYPYMHWTLYSTPTTRRFLRENQ